MRIIFGMVMKWYVFLTALALMGANAFNKISLANGIVMSWLVFLFFSWGIFFRYTDTILHKLPVFKRPQLKLSLPVLALVAAGLSAYVSFFYTGKTFGEVFSSIIIRQSLYKEYQEFFADSDLMVFSIKKIPAILASAVLKLILIYAFITTIMISRAPRIKDYFFLMLVALSYLIFSISRGTSFEMFEILIVLWFSFSLKPFVHQTKSRIISRTNLILLSFAVLAVWGYSYNIAARYEFRELNECSASYDCSSSLFFLLFPSLSELTYKLSGYFTFGIFYISTFIKYLWLASPNNFLLGFLPLGFSTINVNISEFVCGEMIDCGASWHPDLANLFQNFGLLGLVFFAFCLGATCRILTRHILQERDIFAGIAQYFVVLAMMSLPVGNFIVASSSNILALAIALSVFFLTSTKLSDSRRSPRI